MEDIPLVKYLKKHLGDEDQVWPAYYAIDKTGIYELKDLENIVEKYPNVNYPEIDNILSKLKNSSSRPFNGGSRSSNRPFQRPAMSERFTRNRLSEQSDKPANNRFARNLFSDQQPVNKRFTRNTFTTNRNLLSDQSSTRATSPKIQRDISIDTEPFPQRLSRRKTLRNETMASIQSPRQTSERMYGRISDEKPRFSRKSIKQSNRNFIDEPNPIVDETIGDETMVSIQSPRQKSRFSRNSMKRSNLGFDEETEPSTNSSMEETIVDEPRFSMKRSSRGVGKEIEPSVEETVGDEPGIFRNSIKRSGRGVGKEIEPGVEETAGDEFVFSRNSVKRSGRGFGKETEPGGDEFVFSRNSVKRSSRGFGVEETGGDEFGFSVKRSSRQLEKERVMDRSRSVGNVDDRDECIVPCSMVKPRMGPSPFMGMRQTVRQKVNRIKRRTEKIN